MQDKYYPLAIALCLVAMGTIMRLLPHPPNFAPITAIAIFGGSVLPRKFSIWVPMAAMILSDALIGFYPLMPLVWGCYLVIALASRRWLRPASFTNGALLCLSASIFFYVVTNFGVWLTSSMYPHNLSGLINCYIMAIPFFRNTLLSDASYTLALFGIYALATSRLKSVSKAKVS